MTVSTAIDASAVARVVGIKTDYRNLSGGNVRYLPMRVMVFGQGSTASTYSTAKRQVFSANEVGSTYGFGSPLHLAALQLLPANGDGVGTIPCTIYPLVDDVAGVASAGDITPTIGTITNATYYVVCNNIRSQGFLIETGDTVAAIIGKMVTAVNATPEMPIIGADGTTKFDFTSKWKGSSANDIYVEISGPTDAGITWAFTQATGGSGNPTVDSALALIGNVWETLGVNCLELSDTTALDAYNTVGEGRWLPTTRKPFVIMSGCTDATVAAAITISDARKTDRVNAQETSPASVDLPCVIAARAVARIVKTAQNNPPQDYGRQQLTGLTPAVDGDQWDGAQREAAVQGGASTTQVVDGIVNMSDTITFYHPTGDPLPAYRYVVDIIKVMQLLYNTDLIFSTSDWDGAPLIPDDQPTVNPTAKKPKMAKAEIAAMLDNMGLEAIISDPDTAKGTIVAVISSTNPKRLDVTYTVALSGNTNIISIDFYFGFYFGTAPVVG